MIAMAFSVILALAISVTTGIFVTLICWPRRVRQDAEWFTVGCVGAMLGLCISSGLYLLWLVIFRSIPLGWWMLDALALIAAMLGWQMARKQAASEAFDEVEISKSPQNTLLKGLLLAALIGGLILVGWGMLAAVQATPHGQWDAWAMWNFKARSLYLAQDNWLDAFRLPESPHTDYPLLLPLTIARLWAYAGYDAQWIPQGVAIGSALLAVAGVASAISFLRGTITGVVAGLATLNCLFYFQHVSWQYVDVPLSVPVCLSLAVAAIALERENANHPCRGLFFLTGLLAGCAAWTKNEGITLAALLIASLAVIQLLSRSRRQGLYKIGWCLSGFAAVFWMTLIVKLFLAGQNTDLLTDDQTSQAMARLFDLQRWALIWKAGTVRAWQLGDGWVVVAILALATLGLWRHDARTWCALAVVAFTLAGQVLVYGTIYLLLSEHLSWHLNTSASRLFFHLWPAFILLFSLAIPKRLWQAAPSSKASAL